MPGVAMVIYWEVCSGGLQFLAANNKITSRGANMPTWVLWDGSFSRLTDCVFDRLATGNAAC